MINHINKRGPRANNNKIKSSKITVKIYISYIFRCPEHDQPLTRDHFENVPVVFGPKL